MSYVLGDVITLRFPGHVRLNFDVSSQFRIESVCRPLATDRYRSAVWARSKLLNQWRMFDIGSLTPMKLCRATFRFVLYDSVIPVDAMRYFGEPFSDDDFSESRVDQMLEHWNDQLARSSDTRIVGLQQWNLSK